MPVSTRETTKNTGESAMAKVRGIYFRRRPRIAKTCRLRDWPAGIAASYPVDAVDRRLADTREGSVMWRLPVEAPFEQDIELAVIDDEGVHALVFPCQRRLDGWVNAVTGEVLDIHPTHWRLWQIHRCDVSGLQ